MQYYHTSHVWRSTLSAGRSGTGSPFTVYNFSGWEFDISNAEINKINKIIEKIPTNITFTNFISSDNDDAAWDLNDEIQHADKCKTLGNVKVDGYISIDFYMIDDGDDIYVVELNDDESTITCFVGK